MTKSIFMTIVFLGYIGLTFFHPNAYKPTITIVLGILLGGYSFLEYNKKTEYSEIFDKKLEDLTLIHNKELDKIKETHKSDMELLSHKISTVGLNGSVRSNSIPNEVRENLKVWGL